MALPYAHHASYALAPPSSASAAAIVAAEAAGLPHHRFTSPATPVTGDVRTDAAILAYNALAEAAYDRRQAAGPPEAPPAPPAPSASLVESATRYIVKKLAYQESGAGRGAATAATAPAAANGDANGPAAYLSSWEERMAVQKAELKEGLQGLKVQGGTVLEGCDVLVPGHKLVKLVVRAGGKDLVTAEGSEEVTRYVASHDPESVPAGGVILAYFTVPPVMAKGEVVLRKPIELRCRVQASDEQRAAAVKAGMKPPGYDDDFRTFYLPRGTFGHALDRKRPAPPAAGSTGATTPRNPRTPRSAAKKKKASGAADFDAPCIARVSVSANGVPLTFWIEKEFIAGVGDLRDHVGKPAVACRDDLAALLIAAYSDGAESDHGSEVLTREEYASMCSETGIEEDFDAAKDKVLGGVTSRMLKRRAERHLREHADVLREIALSKNASRRATATHGDAVCAAKQAGPPPTMKSIKADLPAISAKLAGLYAKKAGGGLEELVANLVAPQGVDPTLVLAEAAANVLREKGKHYPGKTQFDLLVMVLYTMSGPDIDALMGYRDVPDYVSDREAWDIYVAGKGKERNKALFSEVNGLMRGAADVAACDWSGVARWVKTICHLHHLCVHSPAYDAKEDNALSRGLAGLPAAVVDAHGTLSAEEHLTWTAPSSCAVDKQIAIDYIMGNAANAQKKKTPADGDDSSCDSIFFSVEGDIPGLPLSDLSKYPKEAEVLLPPLSSLRVKRTTTGTPTKGCLTLATEFSAATTMETVAAQVPNDATRCSRVLEQRSAKKNNSVRKMMDGLRHTIPPWLPTSPRPGFRGAPAPDAVIVADHHSTTLLPVVCQNVLSPTSPRRTRSLAKR